MRTEILNDGTDSSQDTMFRQKLEAAKLIYLELVYPFDKDIINLPDERAKHWQVRCAIELYNNNGNENVIEYSENGLLEKYEKSGVSKDLLNILPPPKAGVPH